MNQQTVIHKLFRTITFEYLKRVTCFGFSPKPRLDTSIKNVREVIPSQYTENITD